MGYRRDTREDRMMMERYSKNQSKVRKRYNKDDYGKVQQNQSKVQKRYSRDRMVERYSQTSPKSRRDTVETE